MRPDTVRRFQRFLIGSAASFGLNIGITSFIHEVLGWDPAIAFAIALLAVFTTNFFVLRHFVFEAGAAAAGTQAVRYLLLALGFRGAEYGAFLVVHEIAGVPYLVTATLVLATSTIVKYFVYGSKVFLGGD
ncbi:MAG TPA: GtrA family protein [Gemmatimonadales bacterium]|nr:GtrA family protein [Gemmatimonadales bacterium]